MSFKLKQADTSIDTDPANEVAVDQINNESIDITLE
jgi:hypothetical protein